MGMDFSVFNSDDLWEYSYDQTIKLIEEIEKNLMDTSSIAENIDAIDGMLSCIPIITYRVDEYNFEEISRKQVAKDNKSAVDRQLLQLRLRTLHFSCKAFCENVYIADDYNQKKKELEEAISSLHTEFDDTTKRINSSLAESQKQVADSLDSNAKKMGQLVGQVQSKLRGAEKKLDDSEHNMLTHVLTLMGIFSAVITIIMSLVISATSWLNNASGASAVFAFIIPSAVAVFAVAVLLFLVFLYHNATTGSDTHPIKSKFAVTLFVILLVIIFLLSGVFVWAATRYLQKCEPEHIHYIITPAEYSTKPQETESGEEVFYFHFTLDNEDHVFPFNEAYIHNGNLYFCKEHGTLE